MKIFLLLLAVVALVSARFVHPVKELTETAVKHREVREICQARIEQYPVKGVRLQQANDDTNKIARSYYSKFSIREYSVHSNNGRPKSSQFQVAIEHKTPQQEHISGKKQVKINFYNLLFTASLKISAKEKGCLSLLGFVELVKTDITWYKGRNSINEYRQCNLAKNQYVMTKLIPGNVIFANNTFWGRATLIPTKYEKMVPLKYESTENIVVDFEKHRDTIHYEKLIEKKIFIVQTNVYNKVLDVIAGVDVMTYLDLKTYNVTDVPHLDIKTNHSLIRRIADPQKYKSVITKLDTKAIREEQNCNMHPPWSSISTLNPIPKGIHIYTE